MGYLNKLYTAMLLAVSLVAAIPAQAILLNTGATVTYNFDFTEASPPPPYDEVAVEIFDTVVVPGASATFDIFAGLNATGSLLHTATDVPLPPPGPTVHILLGDPEVVDGAFSIEVTAVQGPFEITNVTDEGRIIGDGTAHITPTIAGSAPEPATLALLSIGLAGLGFSRRQLKQ